MSLEPLGTCHACGSAALGFLPGYPELPRITSDCRPWPAGGKLGICAACGLLQKADDPEWRRETAAIYRDYAIYQQGGGAEQAVFTDGVGQARSARILGWLQARVALPGAGRWLDAGCGNGALLKAASTRLPGWALAGQEISAKHREMVEAIPGVEALYTCGADQVPGSFDAISLIHVLEHIPDPGGYLRRLRGRLAPGGMLLVEVPNHEQNPFDLLIADHASHFEAGTLQAVVRSAGFAVEVLTGDCVPKEWTLLARPEEEGGEPQASAGGSPVPAFQEVAWLQSLLADADAASARRPFGIFGTSIAGTWLASGLRGRVDFFVDEDPARAGGTHLGLPVRHPRELAPGSAVYLAFGPALASTLRERLGAHHPGVAWLLPPPLEA